MGSSPLTRGKPRPGRIPGPPPRLIPAHAGKTTWTGAYSPPTKAHPRSRGENRCGHRRGCGRRGSSPLTRGKHRRPARDRRGLGLIPAHAGKTPRASRQRLGTRAHPRSRGENFVNCVSILSSLGSSPLTRGKPCASLDDCYPPGLIPAHAGKTQVTPSLGLALWAHPRSRGENDYFPTGATLREGSSPLTRGKLVSPSLSCRGLWLIPAHAGKTPVLARRSVGAGAHPRSRGENRKSNERRPNRWGSSPLTRGKLQFLRARRMGQVGSSPLTRGKRA